MAKDNQIRVSCYTNLDGYNLTDIQELACRPVVGDYIAVRRTEHPYHDKLQVISVCHHYVSSHREASLELELG